MKAVVKALILLLSFSIEIRIHASSISDLTFSEECRIVQFGKSIECHALNSNSKTRAYSLDAVHFSVKPGAVFSANADINTPLVKWTSGEGLIKAESGVEVQSSFGKMYCEGHCIGMVKKSSNGLEVTSLKGEWILIGFEEKNQMSLKEGTSVRVGPIDESGGTSWGIPFTLSEKNLNALLKSHSDVLSPNEREVAIKSWRRAVLQISELYKDRAHRKVATHRDQLSRQKRQKEAIEAENKALRDLFRKKSLLD